MTRACTFRIPIDILPSRTRMTSLSKRARECARVLTSRSTKTLTDPVERAYGAGPERGREWSGAGGPRERPGAPAENTEEETTDAGQAFVGHHGAGDGEPGRGNVPPPRRGRGQGGGGVLRPPVRARAVLQREDERVRGVERGRAGCGSQEADALHDELLHGLAQGQ